MFRTLRFFLQRSASLLGLTLSLLLPAHPAQGQEELFLRDFVSLGERVVFKAVNAIGIAEPWVSDGTAAGTRQLVDLCPGPCGAEFQLVRADADELYILASQPPQVWHSDGTPAGTVPLLPPGVAPFPGAPLTLAEGLLYFSSCAGSDCHLWRTDGTPGGTEQVSGASASRLPVEVTAQGGAVYFGTRSDSGVGTLWKTAGARGPAVRVRDFSGPLAQPTAFGGQLYFVLRNETTLRDQLWVSDGSAAGTRMVRPLPGAVQWLLALDGALFFTVERSLQALWTSDGTAAGSRRLSARVDSSRAFFLPRLERLGDRLYFPVEAQFGTLELWTVADTPGSTRNLGGTFPFRAPSVRVGDRILFPRRTDALGAELWQVDGRGLRPFFDLCTGPCNGFLAGPSTAAGRAYFVATTPRFGSQLYATDGTAGGTRRITRFTQGVPGADVGTAGALTFFARYGTGSPDTTELWVTRGSWGTTRHVAEIRLDEGQ